MTVLAIDQGTTSTRAMLLMASGETKVVKTIEHKQCYPQAGWVEHDPETLIQNLRSCLNVGYDFSAIGLANQGESCLAWHAQTKAAICPIIVWQDNRTAPEIESLKQQGLEALVKNKTGLPLDSYFSASKLAWIMQNVPAAKVLLQQGNLRLGTTDAFFLDRLTGNFVSDITTASRTSLMNIDSGQWDVQLCELFGVPIQALPKITSSTGDFGYVEIMCAQDSKLDKAVVSHKTHKTVETKRVPITASIVDQQASLFGHHCRAKGDAKITFGTGAFAMTITGEQVFRAPQQGLLPTVAWQFAGQAPIYALDGGVHCASSALNWAKSLGLFSEFSQINQFDAPPAIERNLVFVPALTGLACPHWDRSAAGLWIGLSLATSPLDMVQAILEGIALRASEVLQAMDEFTQLNGAISIDGGMSANPYFCQFLANVLQREVCVPRCVELTAFGAAMLAKKGKDPTAIQSINSRQGISYQPLSISKSYIATFNKAIERSKNW
ncbi:MAG: glycerol kinase [Oceanospirillaceae bacterium]|jgi:glycerol kinase